MQEDYRFKASLSLIASLRPAGVYQTPSQKKKEKRKHQLVWIWKLSLAWGDGFTHFDPATLLLMCAIEGLAGAGALVCAEAETGAHKGKQTLNFISSKLDRHKNYDIIFYGITYHKGNGRSLLIWTWSIPKGVSVIFHFSKEQKPAKIICIAFEYMGGKTMKKSNKMK